MGIGTSRLLRCTLFTPMAITVLVLALAGCGSDTAGSAPTTAPVAPTATVAPTAPTATTQAGTAGPTVNVGNFQFNPASITVKVGTEVTWKNVSGGHTATSDPTAPAAFDGSLDSGQTFKFTFTKAGTYTYHCSIHPSMHGTIIVTP